MRRGFTVLELLVAMGVFSIALTIVYAFGSRVFGRDRTSAASLAGASFLRQDARLAIQKLMSRVEEGIQVTSPPSGQTGDALEFRDLLNHRVRLRLDGGALVSERARSGAFARETDPATVVLPGGEVLPLSQPVRIPNCQRAEFHVVSPTLVAITLWLTDGTQSGSTTCTVRLRNSRLVDG